MSFSADLIALGDLFPTKEFRYSWASRNLGTCVRGLQKILEYSLVFAKGLLTFHQQLHLSSLKSPFAIPDFVKQMLGAFPSFLADIA